MEETKQTALLKRSQGLELQPEDQVALQTEGPVPELPAQAVLDKIGKPNAPFLRHPGQYKVVTRRGTRVTVRNMGSGEIRTLDVSDLSDAYALDVIEKYQKDRRRARMKANGRMGYAVPEDGRDASACSQTGASK